MSTNTSRRRKPLGPPPDQAGVTLTMQDVAGLLRCCLRQVQRMDSAGEIPGRLKIGRLVRYDRRKVLAWLEALQASH